MVKDTIVKSVLDKYLQRSEVGIKKYNQTMDRDDLNLLDWLTHLQEELMDATLYVEKLKQEYKKK
jgi:succinate dehydrogenase flavin-adding protein (antitoxin of CptAB toxin-antitoxin module)